ncbi:transposase [Pleionea sp. CnH1-48]|uniref:transposase n=1 Tax=Pleionea sp. CnH1-48 TaxID=2954494 RepID=UPI002097FB9F|nr:transposase [Pleionea sp. CnH1-48]MCO7227276.1 transposase [Pleionea sp. CnH1-48]
MKTKTYSQEFKIEAANLLLEQGYTYEQACKAVGVSRSALSLWIRQLRAERSGETPTTGRALTPEQQKIQALEAQLKRAEREKEILKKATALLMSDSIKSSY